MKHRLRGFFLLLWSLLFLPLCSSCQNKRLLLDELLTDMKSYKTYSNHRGDLYEHSMWAEQYLSRWAMGKDKEMAWVQQWMADFTEREKALVALAGLLHDIGKAGDPDCSKYKSYYREGQFIFYFTKKGHEDLGFMYVMHDVDDALRYKPGYLKVNGRPFNMKRLFDELGVTEQERRLIAVLIGSHKYFSTLLHKGAMRVDQEHFLEKTQKLVRESGLKISLNKKLVSMVMVLNIADLCAAYFPVDRPGPSLVFGKFMLCKKVHDFPAEAAMIAAIKARIVVLAPKLRDEILSTLQEPLKA